MEINKLRVVNVLHFYATGPGQEFHNWLVKNKVERAVLIEHPFSFSARRYTRIEDVKSTGEQKIIKKHKINLPTYLSYFIDFFYTLYFLKGQEFDFYIGNGCFDTLAGIVARKFGKVKKVALYTIDYAPNTHGKIYAFIYKLIDRFCCYNVDVIWNLSDRMHTARLTDGMNENKCAPVIRVPHGTHAKEMRKFLPESNDKYAIAFMGHILKKSGLQLFMNGMEKLLDDIPQIHLEVFGGGEYLEALKSLAKKLNIETKINFYGYIENHDELEKQLSRCGIGLALYSPEEANFSYCADPGKVKVYLACGLPVIISDVPQVAEDIEKRKAGIKIDYDVEAMTRAVKKILTDYTKYRNNALQMANEFDWDNIFNEAIKKTRVSASLPNE